MECPERICSKCQLGYSIREFNIDGGYFTCSHCKKEFVGNPCTAGEKKYNINFIIGYAFELARQEKLMELVRFLNEEIENLLKSEREKLMNDIDLLIVNEINLARSDGFSTSRLTSLMIKFSKLK